MLKHLEGYLTINEITNPDALLQVGKHLIEHPRVEIMNLARKGYVLEAFQQLVTEDITLEQFLCLGDVVAEGEESTQPVDIFRPVPWREAVSYVRTKLVLDETYGVDCVLVVEKQIWQATGDKSDVKDVLKVRGGSVFQI